MFPSERFFLLGNYIRGGEPFEAEAAGDDSIPEGAVFTRENKSVPVSVGLSVEDARQIELLAERLQVPTSVLILGWISEGLASYRDDSVQSALVRLESDLVRLRNIVA
jgi:hypothetical protein